MYAAQFSSTFSIFTPYVTNGCILALLPYYFQMPEDGDASRSLFVYLFIG